MGKKKKSTIAKPTCSAGGTSEDRKKGVKVECCDKYIKKGEHKRCKRCPCFDMSEEQRSQRFDVLEITCKLKNHNDLT